MIVYDYKNSRLIIEVSDQELRNLAQQECDKHGEQELLVNKISHITYGLPIDPTKAKKKFSIGCALAAGFWIVGLALAILGVMKLAELLAKWTG